MLYLKSLFKNNGAVSPVIGVVLMVAITVILAAAIGSSVLGEGTSAPAPQANINIEVDTIGTSGGNDAIVILEHLGGDPINFDKDGTTTKVVATISDASKEVVLSAEPSNNDGITNTFILDVGDTQQLILTSGSTTDDDEIVADSGKTVNIKIIDVATQQLICEQDVRF